MHILRYQNLTKITLNAILYKISIEMKKIEVNMERQDLTMQADVKEFAMALKTWRLRQGLSQEKVGQMFGLSRWTIIKIEQAQPIKWETAYRAFAKLSFYLQKETQV